MTKSLLQPDIKQCFLCGRKTTLELHHIYSGIGNRKWSTKYGCWCWLCHDCHTGTEGAQYDKEKNLYLKQECQRAFEEIYPREKFRKIFGKSYL